MGFYGEVASAVASLGPLHSLNAPCLIPNALARCYLAIGSFGPWLVNHYVRDSMRLR